jgi:quercetin dioxygenase-like cupin family protein
VEILDDPQDGASIDATQTMYPSRLVVHARDVDIERPASTTYGFVVSGRVGLHASGIEATLDGGGFFALPGSFQLRAASGHAVLIERVGFRGLPSLGRIEEVGRLAYIDGCSDTVLCLPPRLGDPVLNHLHFPSGIQQSLHSHPSIRLGVVARGAGVAYGPGWDRALRPGAVFMLRPHEVHAFRTSDSSMDVIAYHPDSDWGPTDGIHPMINRTYLARR